MGGLSSQSWDQAPARHPRLFKREKYFMSSWWYFQFKINQLLLIWFLCLYLFYFILKILVPNISQLTYLLYPTIWWDIHYSLHIKNNNPIITNNMITENNLPFFFQSLIVILKHLFIFCMCAVSLSSLRATTNQQKEKENHREKNRKE